MDKLILGTVQMGLPYGINNQTGKPNQAQAFEILQTAHEQNISILDTADAYGNSSNIIGAYHQKSNTRFQVNTKFHFSSETSLQSQIDNSLSKLSVDSINAYFFHRFQDFINHPSIIDDLQSLKSQKKIKKIGISIYTNDELEKAISSQSIDVIQLPFNLLDNFSQRGCLLKLAKQKNKEIQARSVFLQGFFFKAPKDLPPLLTPLKPYLQKIHDIAKSYQISLHSLALNYAIHTSEIDYVLFGVETMAQLQSNVRSITSSFSLELFQEINKIKVEETDLLNPVNWKS